MSRLPLISLVALFVIGCSTPEPEAEKKAPAPASNAKADPGPVPSEIATSEVEPKPSGTETETETETDEEETGEAPPLPDHFEEIGVAVCDQYVTDFQRCIDEKVPEADRDGHRRTLADNHASWTQTKKGGESAAKGLQIGCRGAREQAKAATAAFGCTW